ncbi:uncharacterized protein BJ212DRAFT_1357095 [Suillus subaureus]|uniref:F-box domain-containing protein n=1 Tax=Suillus subaureus TaxID=48587 RepID=A0A9P7EAB9_9AGAM|nr:uncharacterized protein BJ212DRAFT_1357095 [Suillus subaureus]KAG1815521.1 hypothetical protein BJ212DRAFT_1357095 [Suillus subaureus]
MHICLLPTEILFRIFTTIYGDTTSMYEDSITISRATLATLARTCRTFKEPALDILWKHLDGFEPLVLCLPESVRNRDVQGKLTLKRPPFIREWRIVCQYAQRIHFLSIDQTSLDIIDDRVIQTLMFALPPTPLLPNLRTLHWWDARDRFLPLLRFLLGSTITSLELGFDDRAPSFARSALLTSLSARCPFIREFTCTGHGEDSQEILDVICEAVCGWQKLSHFSTGILNTQALTHLATLSSLKSLSFETCDLNDMQPNSTPIFFRQLNDVSISTSSPSALTQYLRNVHFLSCRSMQLSIYRNNNGPVYDPLDIPDFIASLSEGFSPDLEQLEVLLNTGFERSEELNDPRFAIAFGVIAPLLSLRRLTTLDLSWLCTSAIDDVSLKRMAQSWPELERFHFGGGVRWLVPPSLTFIGLIHLVHHCRRLHTIEMTFHAGSIDTNSELFSKIIPNNNITSVDVGFSPIVDPFAVACQLHALLPNLTEVFAFRDMSFGPALFKNLEAEWKRVNEFLKTLIAGAKIKEKIDQRPY